MSNVYLVEVARTLPGGKKATYYVLRWPGRDGKSQQQSLGRSRKSGGKLTRTGAEAMRRQKAQDIGVGRISCDNPRKMTLGQFVHEHRAVARAKVRPTTLVEYDIAGQHAVNAIGQDMPLTRIDSRAVAAIENHLHDLGRSSATVNKTLRALRAMFTRAVKPMELVARNPFAGWELPKSEPREMRIFDQSEIREMIAAAPSVWWATLIRLAAESGLRKMELLHLRWSDVDFEAQTVGVASRRQGSFKTGGVAYPIIAWSAKAKASHPTVPLPQAAMTAIADQLHASDGSAYVFLSLWRLSQVRRHLGSDGDLPAKFDLVPNMRRDLLAIQRKAGVNPPGCLHGLRRAYATRVASAIPMHVLKEYMGHADIATTARYYLATTESDAEKLRAALMAEA